MRTKQNISFKVKSKKRKVAEFGYLLLIITTLKVRILENAFVILYKSV